MIKHSILYLLILCIVSACSSSKEKEETEREEIFKVENTRIPEVKAKLVQLEDFNYELISNGTVSAMQKAEVRFQSQELISNIYVKNGTRVNEGQILAELDKFKLEHTLQQAKENLERAKLDLQDVLIGQGFSLNDLTNIPEETMKIAKIRSNYDQSESNLTMAQYNFDVATLRAPFNGVVANMNQKTHNQPGGDPFCTVINNAQPEVVFNILENELPLVNINDKVIVSPFSNPSITVIGYVSEINPMIDKNGMVKVKASIPNKDNKFVEGMNVRVKVQRLLNKQILVPKSALVKRTNRDVIFILENGKSSWVYVEVGQENSDSFIITEGIYAGDSVIYDGNINLAHDAIVKLIQ